ncbi:hypothetical protein EES45_35515 [Streptomyces sp. ADI97-07]|nr:hypothetical protein EES45_35515 [Streptomyces sp. ADI97-07]
MDNQAMQEALRAAAEAERQAAERLTHAIADAARRDGGA